MKLTTFDGQKMNIIHETWKLETGSDRELSIYRIETMATGEDLLASWLGAVRPWKQVAYVVGRRGEWRWYSLAEWLDLRTGRGRRRVLPKEGRPYYATVKAAVTVEMSYVERARRDGLEAAS